MMPIMASIVRKEIHNVASRYGLLNSDSFEVREELYQEGLILLLQCLRKKGYDPKRELFALSQFVLREKLPRILWRKLGYAITVTQVLLPGDALDSDMDVVYDLGDTNDLSSTETMATNLIAERTFNNYYESLNRADMIPSILGALRTSHLMYLSTYRTLRFYNERQEKALHFIFSYYIVRAGSFPGLRTVENRFGVTSRVAEWLRDQVLIRMRMLERLLVGRRLLPVQQWSIAVQRVRSYVET
jgi:hypothetical protein